MMVIKRVKATPNIRDTVGAAQDVLIWGYGTTRGRVAAVQVLTDGSADVVVEFEVPQAVEVPDDWCARAGRCRLDSRCPYIVDCNLHECDDECGGCQP